MRPLQILHVEITPSYFLSLPFSPLPLGLHGHFLPTSFWNLLPVRDTGIRWVLLLLHVIFEQILLTTWLIINTITVFAFLFITAITCYPSSIIYHLYNLYCCEWDISCKDTWPLKNIFFMQNKKNHRYKLVPLAYFSIYIYTVFTTTETDSYQIYVVC